MNLFEIEGKEGGERIDAYLAREIEGLTRSAVQRLIDAGCVTLCGLPLKKNYRVSGGEVFSVAMPNPAAVDVVAEKISLDVVYEDSDVIVINKAVGMVVHPAAGHSGGTLVNALLYHCAGSLSGINGELRPGIVHRIDKDTSGLIIAAKNDAAHISLAKQLKDHSLSRTYEAVVCGNLRDDTGTIDAPIGRHHTDRKRMTVTDHNSRRAVTHYQVVTRYSGYTHVRCMLETGRTHQIRVHMEYVGHPVLGDAVYRGKNPGFDLAGQCLHARELKFIHPRSGQLIEVTCPLPEYFEKVLTKLSRLV